MIINEKYIFTNNKLCLNGDKLIRDIKDYEEFADKKLLEQIEESASHLEGKHIVHVNSTSSGGGVAEILNSMVPLMNKLGIRVGWRLLKGSHTFFDITKRFHNALQGESIIINKHTKKIYLKEIERNSIMNHLDCHDLVLIHDPQPLAMIKYNRKKQPWIWRCHIDIKEVHSATWDFLSSFMQRYDGIIVSMEKYTKKNLKAPQYVIHPSIDPLSDKNCELSDRECEKRLLKNGVSLDKPIICQVSRFDKWKGLHGTVRMFKEIRKKIDCRLVLMGDMVEDDPEGHIIYSQIQEETKQDPDIIMITKRNDKLVNALQRKSEVVIQNSHKEGFGLVVSEALWKKTPVIGTARGGIPLQIIDGKTGFLIKNEHEGVKRCIKIMENRKLRKKLGEAGREHVKKNFLITRNLKDHLDLYNFYLNGRKTRHLKKDCNNDK